MIRVALEGVVVIFAVFLCVMRCVYELVCYIFKMNTFYLVRLSVLNCELRVHGRRAAESQMWQNGTAVSGQPAVNGTMNAVPHLIASILAEQ